MWATARTNINPSGKNRMFLRGHSGIAARKKVGETQERAQYSCPIGVGWAIF
jgi:hypothetical protein